MEDRDKKQRTSIFRKWLLARRRRKPKHLLAGSKSGEARILWPRPVKEQQDQQPSTFPGREKGNLSCIIYMGEREREMEEEKRWTREEEKSFLPSYSAVAAPAATHTRHLAAAASPAVDRSRFITVKCRGP